MLHKRGMPGSLTAQILFEELSPKPVCDPRGGRPSRAVYAVGWSMLRLAGWEGPTGVRNGDCDSGCGI